MSASVRARDATLLALAALLVRIPIFLTPQALGFDDGQFAESVLAMRAGGLPFRDVFSSQGPLFLPLAWFGDLVTFRSLDSPRTLAVLSGAVLTAAVYLAGRELTDRAGAILAAVLVAVSGSVLWTTGPLTADGPGEALGTATVAVALAYRRAPSTRKAIAIGALAGAAFSVKSLLVVPAIVAAGLIVLASRRRRNIAAVPLVAVGAILVIALPWGLHRVYEQSVRYHTDQAGQRAIGDNAGKAVGTLLERDAPLLAAGAMVGLAALGAARRRARRPREAGRDLLSRAVAGPWPVVIWLGLAIAVLLLEAPMWRSHVSHLVPPAALLVCAAARSPRYVAIAAVAAIAVLPWHLAQLGDLFDPGPYSGYTAHAERILRALPPGAQAISDEPGLVWRAGRRTPDRFVDVSILRITSPRPGLRITEDDVVRGARGPAVCAVLRWSSERFARFEGLGRRLAAAGYRPALERRHSPRKVWVKRACAPTARSGTPIRGRGPASRTTAAAGPSRSPG